MRPLVLRRKPSESGRNEPARVKLTSLEGVLSERTTKKPAPSMAMSVSLVDDCRLSCFEISAYGAAVTPPAE